MVLEYILQRFPYEALDTKQWIRLEVGSTLGRINIPNTVRHAHGSLSYLAVRKGKLEEAMTFIVAIRQLPTVSQEPFTTI